MVVVRVPYCIMNSFRTNNIIPLKNSSRYACSFSSTGLWLNSDDIRIRFVGCKIWCNILKYNYKAKCFLEKYGVGSRILTLASELHLGYIIFHNQVALGRLFYLRN